MEKINLLHELKIRHYNEKLDWEKYGFEKIKFPPLYKAFLDTYDVESYNDESSFSFFCEF